MFCNNCGCGGGLGPSHVFPLCFVITVVVVEALDHHMPFHFCRNNCGCGGGLGPSHVFPLCFVITVVVVEALDHHMSFHCVS